MPKGACACQCPRLDQFALTEDGSQVVYQAIQDTSVPRLYRVDVLGPGASIELSKVFVADGALLDFAIGPGLRLIE